MLNMRILRKLVVDLLSVFALTFLLSTSTSAQSDKKVAYAVLIDNTGSMRSQFQDVLTIAEEILDHIPEQATVSLYNFKTEPSRKSPSAVISSGVGWSQNKALQKQYLSSLAIVPGQTTLLDAISSMTKELNIKVSHDGDRSTEKIMFLITDGEERTSKTKETQLMEELTNSNIKVYIFGMVKELDKEGGFTHGSARAVDLLGRIAKETGGRAVFSRSKKDDILSLLNEMFSK